VPRPRRYAPQETRHALVQRRRLRARTIPSLNMAASGTLERETKQRKSGANPGNGGAWGHTAEDSPRQRTGAHGQVVPISLLPSRGRPRPRPRPRAPAWASTPCRIRSTWPSIATTLQTSCSCVPSQDVCSSGSDRLLVEKKEDRYVSVDTKKNVPHRIHRSAEALL
jgi:hypothetical protein